MEIEGTGIRQWDELPADERIKLLSEFGQYQDELPRTCSLPLKVERFQTWLRSRGIEYQHAR